MRERMTDPKPAMTVGERVLLTSRETIALAVHPRASGEYAPANRSRVLGCLPLDGHSKPTTKRSRMKSCTRCRKLPVANRSDRWCARCKAWQASQYVKVGFTTQYSSPVHALNSVIKKGSI